jgi:hypothetical protein
VRLDPTDEAAWGTFVERDGRHFYCWSRQCKPQDADAEVVTQVIPITTRRGASAAGSLAHHA